MKRKKRDMFDELAERFRGEGVSAPCAHFGECGGCLFQDIRYGDQLLLKREWLRGVLSGVCDVGDVGASDPLSYRNRMDMVSAFGASGLRVRGSFRRVVDVRSCEIMQERSRRAFMDMKPLLAATPGYDYLRHEGFLRYTVLRQARFTNELMINFVTASREDRLGALAEAACGMADSVSLILNEGLADLNTGEVYAVLKRGRIEEDFDGVRYEISPNSFFQSNSEIARVMYREIRDQVKGRVLDLYSGVGSISLFAACAAEHVTGVEMSAEGVDTARANAELNGIANAEFVCADALDFLRERAAGFDTLVLDPPRGGVHPKAVKRVNECAPEKIVYMSCNPVTFRDDVKLLENYRVESFRAWDMFPQTPHVETLAVLKRK
ncbi:MAG: 23S rRNA (uracil(1939)-C(5))-methyltransferase RlmD [Spirochaetes bacterium]|nr:MAG: 23S rRNA (uracil(1939)-C(5))-methyltransferase RlmD [Spirochaetota bacterium]